MKTLLLLAGRSRRFWPLTEKTLFPICGKTLLEHQVERLRAGGCTDIILVGGAHNLEQAKEIFPDLPMIEQEDLELGMRGALLSALPQCGSDAVMIVGGNDVIEPTGYADLIAVAAKADGALLAQKVTRYFPGGYLKVDGARITSIIEKPGAGKEPSGLVNIVAHIHNDASVLLDALKGITTNNDDAYELAIDALFKKKTYQAVPYEGPWFPVKYPWHLIPLLGHLLTAIKKQSIDPSATIHPTAVIEGPVVIGAGTKVLPHATIVGPCVIGRRCVIGNNALLRSASIGDDCVVGYCTEVKESVLHSHVWAHITYLGESVIGRNVSFGARTTTGNFRLDEKEILSLVSGEKIATGLHKFGTAIGDNTRIGIHVAINPGVKIGGGSFVSSSVVLTEDIPENSFVSMKDGTPFIRSNSASAPAPEEREGFRRKIS